MQDHEKTRDQLIDELNDLRQVIHDLERKTAEQTLLLNTIEPQVWYLTDAETHGLVNQSRADFLGKRREEIEGQKLHDLYSPDVTAVCEASNAEAFQSRQTVYTEELIPNAVGEPRWISIIKTPRLDQNGNVEYVVCAGTDITERKRMQSVLQDSEERYKSLYGMIRLMCDNVPDMIWAKDMNRQFIFTNRAMCQKLLQALDTEEPIGKTDMYFAERERAKHPDQADWHTFGEICVDSDTIVMSTKTPERFDEFGNVNGRMLFLDVYKAPFFDELGNLIGTVGCGRDVTREKQLTEARKLAEDALIESEERHRSLIEHLPQRIFIKDRNSVYLSCNRNYASDLGITPEEIVGKDDFAFHTHELAQAYRADDEACMSTGMATVTEELYQLAGQDRWAHTIKVPYRDSHRQIIGVLGIFEDITDRKRAAEALKVSEQRFRRVFEQGPFGMAIASLDYRWLAVNQRLCEITGYSSEELTKLSFVDITHPDDLAHDVAQAATLARGEIPYHRMQKRYIKKDKEIAWIDLTATIIRNEQNEPMYFLSMMEDITAKKKSEQDQELLRNQLFQCQKLEALGTLVGGIAHDFNNMLQIILGYSQLLLGYKEQGDLSYKDLQTIIQAVQGGADLVNKLLAFGQQAPIFPVNLDLSHKIRELNPLLSRTLPPLVKIDLDLTHGPSTIHADPNQIDQVVMNLAINASEAMPDGGRLKIGITAVMLDDEYCLVHPGVEPGEYVILSLSDTGRGMDGKTLARIFEPFFSTKQRGSTRGTGLGLSVVRGIVEQQGGHVICESEAGKGSEFKIYFPAIQSEPTAEKKTDSPTQSAAMHTILVVEDNILVAELAQKFLTSAGYIAIIAANGKEALDIYRKQKDQISLIILDLLMPEMSGRDCLMELVKIDPTVRVLIASGFSPSDALRKEINPLIKGFVQKPFGLIQLLDAVESVLSGK